MKVGERMKHQKEWHTCDRCGAEIEIPKEKKWYDCITPYFREVKLKKSVSFDEYTTNICQKIVLPEPKLSQIDSIRLKEYYVSETKSIDLCPKCRKDFEEFMRNDR